MVNFKIISTGWRCEEYSGRCIDSIGAQSYRNFTGFSIIDKSPRVGKIVNFMSGLSWIKPQDEDVVVDLDLDDYLEPGALEIVAQTYNRNPGILLTYGSYRMESGRAARFNGEYTTNNFRSQKWKASHLKTFKYKLLKNVAACDLQDEKGKWLMTCADLALMYPMLEMAGLDRIKHIKECIYCYNDLNPLNDHKVAKEDQVRTTAYLKSKTPYKRLVC